MWLNQVKARVMVQILGKFKSQGMLGLGGIQESSRQPLHLQMKKLSVRERK